MKASGFPVATTGLGSGQMLHYDEVKVGTAVFLVAMAGLRSGIERKTPVRVDTISLPGHGNWAP